MATTEEYTGPRLKQLRRRARLTQMQVVEMCGVSETTICYLERGDRRPQGRTLQRLLNLYATRIQYWNQLSQVLNGDVHAQGKISPQTPEWKRSSGLAHGGNLQETMQSRPLSLAQGVSGIPGEDST